MRPGIQLNFLVSLVRLFEVELAFWIQDSTLEERLRRDNLFFAVSPTAFPETCRSQRRLSAQSTTILELDLFGEVISRAHRLGLYTSNNRRRITG